MKVGEIVKDSIKYPFSDWKKFLIFGFLFGATYLYQEIWRIIPNYGLFIVLLITGFIFQLFAFGYLIKIIELSLNRVNKLPKFNNLGTMFADGFKVGIAVLIYFFPAVIIISIESSFASASGILDLIITLYVAVVIPIFLISMANMMNYEGKFRFAFNYRGIFKKISFIGRLNFIK